MSAKFVAYEYVPRGFEMVIENPDVEMGKVWNLWFNVKLTDDPEAWDDEIRLLNEVQDRLGEVTLEQRLIRAQMAEFCRLHPPFPRSIDILCAEIGTGGFSQPVSMGCEGRGLLNSLGYHDLGSLNEQRKEVLTEYVRSLERWQEEGQPETARDAKVFGFLGQRTDRKMAWAEKLMRVIDPDESLVSPLRGFAEHMCKDTCKDFDFLGRPFNCFECLPEELSTPECQCCYSMFIDAGLLCIGTFGERRAMSDEFRAFTEESILAYASAINSWLKEVSAKLDRWPEEARYVSMGKALEIAERVRSYLGEKDEAKEWLAGCLLKTVKDNQRWHKRTELIDGFPETASWFRERLEQCSLLALGK